MRLHDMQYTATVHVMQTDSRHTRHATLAVRNTQWTRHMAGVGLPTYAEQADRMGVSPTTVGRVVTGKTTPSPGIISAALLITGRPFEDLFEVVTEHARRQEVTAA